jgi:hypothetical protein
MTSVVVWRVATTIGQAAARLRSKGNVGQYVSEPAACCGEAVVARASLAYTHTFTLGTSVLMWAERLLHARSRRSGHGCKDADGRGGPVLAGHR